MQTDPLSRFYAPQEQDYPAALREIRNGHKDTHWMWYIFPQLYGLGCRPNALYFGIRDEEEARQYLADPVLGPRLLEITSALLALPGNDPGPVMGYPDALKLRSCLTLFAQISAEGSVFHQALDKYYGGRPDERTLSMLKKHRREAGAEGGGEW